MDYLGLYRKYPVNRPLTDQDRLNQLRQKTRIEKEPAYQLSVIRLNSTYLELVDKFYAWKGAATTLAWVGLIMVASLLTALVVVSISTPGRLQEDWPTLVGIGAMSLPLDFVLLWVLLKESFAYTHYPLRFNRKTRMVHVFRLDGSVLSVGWDEVFFCLASSGQNFWNVVGHVLDKDRKMVLETFPLPAIAGGSPANLENLRTYWEFVRRYMEEGPKDAAERVEIFLPIATHKERIIDGFHRQHAEGGNNVVMSLIFACIAGLLAPGRWFAIRTSEIPAWPKEVDDVCVTSQPTYS